MNNYKIPKYSVLFALLFFSFVSEGLSAEARGDSVHVMGGLKELDWETAHEQLEVGLEYIVRKKGFPLAIVFEFLGGYGSSAWGLGWFGEPAWDSSSSSTEMGVGLRYEFEERNKNVLYLEAGISKVNGHLTSTRDNSSPDYNFSASANGFWVGGGKTWLLKNNQEHGFKLKFTQAKTNLASNRTVYLGGAHLIYYFGKNY